MYWKEEMQLLELRGGLSMKKKIFICKVRALQFQLLEMKEKSECRFYGLYHKNICGHHGLMSKNKKCTAKEYVLKEIEE